MMEERVLGGGDSGAEGAEQFVCAHCGGPANQRCTGTEEENSFVANSRHHSSAILIHSSFLQLTQISAKIEPDCNAVCLSELCALWNPHILTLEFNGQTCGKGLKKIAD